MDFPGWLWEKIQNKTLLVAGAAVVGYVVCGRRRQPRPGQAGRRASWDATLVLCDWLLSLSVTRSRFVPVVSAFRSFLAKQHPLTVDRHVRAALCLTHTSAD